MEKDIALGKVGNLSLAFSGGKAIVGISASQSFDGGVASASASLSATADAEALVDLVFAAIEKASPAGAVPIEEGVKAIVKAAAKAAG